MNVYNLAVRWVEADFPRRRALVPQIMNTVRFASMSDNVLLDISSHARILDGHANLRQEIADLHLRVHMEDSGLEIPPQMDWTIPRRARRVLNAAKAYAQSGGDLNVLMLHFCPRGNPWHFFYVFQQKSWSCWKKLILLEEMLKLNLHWWHSSKYNWLALSSDNTFDQWRI